MKIFYFGLAFVIEKSSDQTERAQLIFVVGIINCKLYIL